MLGTSEERVKLLKAGISGRTIEKLYLMHNNLKVVDSPVLFELVEINTKENEDYTVDCQTSAENCCL
jgi:hypothetical protein